MGKSMQQEHVEEKPPCLVVAKEQKKKRDRETETERGKGGAKIHPSKTRPSDLLPSTRPRLLCPMTPSNHEDISEHPEVRSEPLGKAVHPKGPSQNSAVPRTEPLGALHNKRTTTEPLDDEGGTALKAILCDTVMPWKATLIRSSVPQHTVLSAP